MGKVSVVIVDATGNKEQRVGLPDDVKIGIIMIKLIEKIKLPATGPDGNPISYKFIHKVSGRQLLETQTLADAHIKDGDVLRLQPEITAGAICGNCGTTLPDNLSFCTECGQAIGRNVPPPVQPSQGRYAPPVNFGTPTTFENAGYQAQRTALDSRSNAIKVLGIIASILCFLTSFLCLVMEEEFIPFAFFFCAQGLFGLAATFYMTRENKR